MTEIIESIESYQEQILYDDVLDSDCITNYDVRYTLEGYKVTTNLDEIIFAIRNDQICCEQWGYLTSEDNLAIFIGHELRSITITNEEYHNYEVLKEIKRKNEEYQQEYDTLPDRKLKTIFVTIQTDIGPFQFVAYNYHNGYYGHAVKVRSKISKLSYCENI